MPRGRCHLVTLSPCHLVILCLCLVASPGRAQGTRSDYERAGRLASQTRNKVFKAEVRAHWFAHGTRFWYRNDLPGGETEYI
ncbi:MAG: hypothetical protein JO112_04260, partial [Planctomycetes bacterium]|nr:hypothetical protein [Planctomycetota bacterium]